MLVLHDPDFHVSRRVFHFIIGLIRQLGCFGLSLTVENKDIVILIFFFFLGWYTLAARSHFKRESQRTFKSHLWVPPACVPTNSRECECLLWTKKFCFLSSCIRELNLIRDFSMVELTYCLANNWPFGQHEPLVLRESQWCWPTQLHASSTLSTQFTYLVRGGAECYQHCRKVSNFLYI